MSITNPTKSEIAGILLFSRLSRRLKYRPFVERMGLRGDEQVLDFGAGWGDSTFYVSPRLNDKGHVTLLDISSGWQEVAKKRLSRFSNLSFVNADIFSAGIGDGSFDVIVVHFMLHDIPRPDRGAIVKELANKLKPGGYMFLGEPTARSHGMTADEILSLMSAAGLVAEVRRQSRRYFEGKFTRPEK